MKLERDAQIEEWMATKPVIRYYINSEVVEITGEDRRQIFEKAYDELLPEITLKEALSKRKIWNTVSDFWSEFSNEEKYAIEVSQDPTLVVLRADLKLWQKDVWSDDLRIQFGLNKIKELGIISEDRKTQILSKIS